MVQKIKITNFFSIREPLEVSFEASKDKQYSEDWIVTIGNFRLLKALLLFGANGSGKTNILCALDFLRNTILDIPQSVDSGFNFMPFALDPNTNSEPTDFDLIFFIGKERYRYTISLNTKQILSEELRIFTSHNATKILYNRKFDKEKGINLVRFGSELGLSSIDKRTLTNATRKNISVLAAYSSLNLSNEELNKVWHYFRHNFFTLRPMVSGEEEVARAIKNNSNLKRLVIELLKTFHSNIIDIEVEQKKRTIPEDAKKFLLQFNPPIEEKEQLIKGTLTDHTNVFIHRTSLGEFALKDELQSEGTMSFIHHLVVFYQAIKNKELLALDEFGAGMQAKTHNLLLDFFLKFSRSSQLIIATQSLGFLDYQLIRRDSICIVSKNSLGQTKIDNKTVRNIHKNIKLRKAYIDGKFTSIDPNEPDIDLNDNKEKFLELIYEKERKEVGDEKIE